MKRHNKKITLTELPSFIVRGGGGNRKPYVLIDSTRVEVTQPRDEDWNEALDHTPILYVIDLNLRKCRNRIPKTTMINKRNRDEVGEVYRDEIHKIMEKIKEEDERTARRIYKEASLLLTEPWKRIVKRRPESKSPHWNFDLARRWNEMRKEREKAKKSKLEIDWKIFKERRKHFEQENRRSSRAFQAKTENMLKNCTNSEMAEAIKEDRRRRQKKKKENTYRGTRR